MTPTVRTRFAPSPTGEPHLGNARTAILNWLFARNRGGSFVLRFEDTDMDRNVAGGEEAMIEALDWLGLDRDEGPRAGGPYGPYRQSERADRYASRAQALLASGVAFRCFCSPDQLEADRVAAIAAGEPPGLDRRCRDLPAVEADRRAAAVRLRVDPGPVEFVDRLKGLLVIDGNDLGDMILIRGDGRATYNFAVTVDDLEMEISHVIRGVSHLSNTPKQVLLYRAFGVEPPEFIHIPQVLAPGGGKLSKRAGAPGVLEYRDEGYHPEAVLNYLSLLSWSAESGEEFLTRDALIAAIDLDRIGAADAEIDPEKMRWLSGQHLRHEPAQTLADRWEGLRARERLGLGRDDLVRAAEVFAKRTHLVMDAEGELDAVFAEPDITGPDATAALGAEGASLSLESTLDRWRTEDWTPGALKESARAVMGEIGVPGKVYFPAIRVGLTGALHGPDLGETAYALGRPRTIERLARALVWARSSHGPETEDR